MWRQSKPLHKDSFLIIRRTPSEMVSDSGGRSGAGANVVLRRKKSQWKAVSRKANAQDSHDLQENIELVINPEILLILSNLLTPTAYPIAESFS